MEGYEREFMVVVERGYLKVRDLVSVRRTCRVFREALDDRSQFWLVYASKHHDGKYMDYARYLHKEGVLSRAMYFNEHYGENNYSPKDEYGSMCPFCLRNTGCDMPDLSSGKKEPLVSVCNAKMCPGYAKFLLKVKEEQITCEFEAAFEAQGLHPEDNTWNIVLGVRACTRTFESPEECKAAERRTGWDPKGCAQAAARARLNREFHCHYIDVFDHLTNYLRLQDARAGFGVSTVTKWPWVNPIGTMELFINSQSSGQIRLNVNTRDLKKFIDEVELDEHEYRETARRRV